MTRLPRWLSGKEPACQCRRCRRCVFDPWVGKISWRRKWQPTPVFLSGKSHGQRSLAGYSPWGHKEPDTIEHAHNSAPLHTPPPPYLALKASVDSRGCVSSLQACERHSGQHACSETVEARALCPELGESIETQKGSPNIAQGAHLSVL